MKKFIIFFILCLALLSLSISATDRISYAIDVLANENGMIKAGVVYNGDILFDTNDFDNALQTNVNKITICSLPSENSGRLMLDNLYVVENQVISREDFSSLRFVPSSFEESESAFTFEANDSGYTLSCTLKTLKSVNFSPSATNGEDISVWTQENISCFGTLSGYDPDGDELKYEIVSYPENGILNLCNAKTGEYKYSPYLNAIGEDTFTYRVMDNFGNYSETATVSIKIDKLRTSLVFNDMSNNKYLNAALIVTDQKIMDCIKTENGEYIFNPEKTITREEFLVLVMEAMGAKDVPLLEKTRFADNEEITKDYRGYVEAAYSLGIIDCTNESDGLHFYPKKEISLAEASIIVNKILGCKFSGSESTFKNNESIPDWARSSLGALIEKGVIKRTEGDLKPDSPLTRAQTAQILMSLLEYRGKLK